MKKKLKKNPFALVELFVALAILAIALIPLAMNFHTEGKSIRGMYYRAVAEQVLDGYREIMVAGEWKKYPIGESTLKITNPAMANLPKGKVILSLKKEKDHKIRIILSWKADKFIGVGKIKKEAVCKDEKEKKI